MSPEVVGFSTEEPKQAQAVEPFRYPLDLERDEFYALAEKILIYVLHRPSEGVNEALFRNAGKWGMFATMYGPYADQHQGFIEHTRCQMVNNFLTYCEDHPKCEHLVMIDNDESPEWVAPYQLAHWGKDVVSGVVCSFSQLKGGVFACFTAKDRYGIARFPSVRNTKTLPARGLARIESAGTGLLCVHKRVFQKMIDNNDPPFLVPQDMRLHSAATGTMKLSEDMSFSKRCRDYGFEQWVDFSVHAKHWKNTAVYWGDGGIDKSLDARTWRVADDDYIHQ